MDCVVDAYNYEEPYSEKKDFTMELNYLDGVPEKSSRKNLDVEMAEEGEDLENFLTFLRRTKLRILPQPLLKKQAK